MIITLAFYYINLKPKVYIFRQYVKKNLHGLYKAVVVLFQSFMIRATYFDKQRISFRMAAPQKNRSLNHELG